jgi:hypothetical protein
MRVNPSIDKISQQYNMDETCAGVEVERGILVTSPMRSLSNHEAHLSWNSSSDSTLNRICYKKDDSILRPLE